MTCTSRPWRSRWLRFTYWWDCVTDANWWAYRRWRRRNPVCTAIGWATQEYDLARRVRVFADHVVPPEELTCWDCRQRGGCQHVWDPFNVGGNCLLESEDS